MCGLDLSLKSFQVVGRIQFIEALKLRACFVSFWRLGLLSVPAGADHMAPEYGACKASQTLQITEVFLHLKAQGADPALFPDTTYPRRRVFYLPVISEFFLAQPYGLPGGSCQELVLGSIRNWVLSRPLASHSICIAALS